MRIQLLILPLLSALVSEQGFAKKERCKDRGAVCKRKKGIPHRRARRRNRNYRHLATKVNSMEKTLQEITERMQVIDKELGSRDAGLVAQNRMVNDSDTISSR